MSIATTVERLVTEELFLKARREEYSTDLLNRRLAGQFILARDYVKALRVQRIIMEEHAKVLQKVDFLVTPTAPIPAPLGDTDAYAIRGTEYPLKGIGAGLTARNTAVANITGLPAITIPCGADEEGLPIGIQFIGRSFDEALLFQIAHQYEGLSPNKGRIPSIAGTA